MSSGQNLETIVSTAATAMISYLVVTAMIVYMVGWGTIRCVVVMALII